MADRKTVTRQTMIGEKGVALIERRCLQMGYLFHPRRVDHGIDGHIDLVDSETGAVLNLALLVQSKAQDRPFTSETGDGFRYLCDQRDLDLWLAGNAPVLLVFSHPERDEAWWVEAKAAFPDAASRAERAVYVDKRTQRFDREAAAALLRLALPKTSGLYLRPPSKNEVLTTNLLPISRLPSTVYLGSSPFTDYPTAGAALAARGQRASGWILRDGLVLSFLDLRESPLNLLCDGDVERHETAEWSASDEIDVQYRFQDLLARTVEDSYPELRWHKDRKHLHFRATLDLSRRKAGKGPGCRGRTVFGPHPSKKNPGEVGYYHHAAIRLRFRRFDGRWYCQLEPDYCFTTDGITEHRYADQLLAGIKRLERHPAVAGWNRMWANHLRGPDQADLFTPERPVQFGSLATVMVERGIDDRWWGPTPAEAASEEDQDQLAEGQTAMSATLAAADIDADDLLTLLDEADAEPDPGGAEVPAQGESPGDGSRRTARKRGRNAR